jgi:transcriptional regulator with XRE-family HTH domain
MVPNSPGIREDGLRELREIRLRRGLSQADLSAITGVAEFTISEIESGKRANPRPSTLRKLAQALEVEVADLYGEPAYPKDIAPSPEPSLFNGLEDERRESIYQHAWRDFITQLADRIAAEAGDKGLEPAWILEISEIPRDITRILFDNGILGNREAYPTEAEYRQSGEIADALTKLDQAVDRAWRAQMRVSEQLEQRREADQLRELREKREADKGSKEARELEAIHKERRGSA